MVGAHVLTSCSDGEHNSATSASCRGTECPRHRGTPSRIRSMQVPCRKCASGRARRTNHRQSPAARVHEPVSRGSTRAFMNADLVTSRVRRTRAEQSGAMADPLIRAPRRSSGGGGGAGLRLPHGRVVAGGVSAAGGALLHTQNDTARGAAIATLPSHLSILVSSLSASPRDHRGCTAMLPMHTPGGSGLQTRNADRQPEMTTDVLTPACLGH